MLIILVYLTCPLGTISWNRRVCHGEFRRGVVDVMKIRCQKCARRTWGPSDFCGVLRPKPHRSWVTGQLNPVHHDRYQQSETWHKPSIFISTSQLCEQAASLRSLQSPKLNYKSQFRYPRSISVSDYVCRSYILRALSASPLVKLTYYLFLNQYSRNI